MLLVEGVITLILGGRAAVSLGEVVAYLLLPPLAMFLVNKTTGGRRPNGVAIGVAVGGAVVLVAALFLGDGVRLLTLPGWVMAVVGLLFLGLAVVLMRQAAPARDTTPVPSLLSQSERDEFTQPGDEYTADGYGDEYGARHGGYDRPAESDWPPPRRDQVPPPAYRAGHAVGDDTMAGPPRVPSTLPGPPEPEWPPRRAAESAEPAWSDNAEPAWSDRPARSAGPAEPDWSQGPTDRAWPPSPSVHEWPPRRELEATAPAPDGGPRSWFDHDGAEPPGSDGPPDREWPPADGSYRSGGRRSRQPDE